jgi:two-component system chemotaxis response regulator CheY
MKALIVDDDPITRMVLQKILSQYAHVQTCADGNEAVAAYRSSLQRGELFDLICMDVLMPGMGGIEALAHIRREEELNSGLPSRNTKVIMTTASDDNDTIRQSFNGLCDAYVIKPIDAAELIDVVHCLFPVERTA